MEDVGLMIWNRAHAELSYLQEIDKWKDKVMAEDTGIEAASTYNVNCSQGRNQNFGGPIIPRHIFLSVDT